MILKIWPVPTEKPRIRKVKCVPGKDLEYYLKGIPLKGQKIIVSGKIVDDLSFIPKDSDEIIVTAEYNAPVVGAIVALASAAWAVAVAHPFIAIAFVLFTAYSIYSFLSMPRVPNFNQGVGLDQGSPTYTWEGGRTIQEVGTPVPIVYGQHKVWGNVINQYQTTNGDNNFIHLLLLLCEGEIEGISDIKINDIPIESYQDVTSELRYGTNDQDPVTGFADLHDLHDLNIQLKKNQSFVYTTVNNDVEGFELYFSFPQGLFKQETNGGLTAWEITYKVEYRVFGELSYINLGNTTVSNNNRNNFRRIFRQSSLTPHKYEIRITKVSDNPDSTHVGELHLTTVDELKSENIAYVNSALLAIHALATNQLSGSTPNISCIVNGKKVQLPPGEVTDVILDLEFEAADESQDFVDSSNYDHPISVEDTAYGDVEHDTGEPIVDTASGYFQNWMGNDSDTRTLLRGTSSPVLDYSADGFTYTNNGGITIDSGDIVFDGTDDSLVCTNITPGRFGAEADFTIDLEIKPSSAVGDYDVMGYMNSGATDISWFLKLESGLLKFYFTSDGTTIIDPGISIDLTSPISGGSFAHVTFERFGYDLFAHLSGLVVGSAIDIFNGNDLRNTATGKAVRVGILATAGNPFLGRMREVRLSHRGRWHGLDFTPMPREYGPALLLGLVPNGGALKIDNHEVFALEDSDFDIKFEVKFRYGLTANLRDKPCTILSKGHAMDTVLSYYVDINEELAS